ncbi:hypothetical protein [Bacillus mojavensis]|uniref:hypothetical protein n=1 Tax=Bacillus mojavensis TaxID=72360 RepID=UPI00227DD258|nr:hypothetical protein [Bacillus mojavensis]MCY9090880.1 hypothetical protein [Bacillus mojavensis]
MKPTITKQQAEAIEFWTQEHDGDTYKERLIKAHVDAAVRWGGMYAPLNDLDLLTLAAALVNGYEVEKTPEERVQQYYYDLRRAEDRLEERGESGPQFRQGWQSVEETLNLLGIQIEGVNA